MIQNAKYTKLLRRNRCVTSARNTILVAHKMEIFGTDGVEIKLAIVVCVEFLLLYRFKICSRRVNLAHFARTSVAQLAFCTRFEILISIRKFLAGVQHSVCIAYSCGVYGIALH